MRTVQEVIDVPRRQQEAKEHILCYLSELKLTYVEAWAICDAVSWEIHRLNEEAEKWKAQGNQDVA